MDTKEFDAILKLLEDPDKVVYELVEKKLLSEGENIIPLLETAWENSLVEVVHQRAEAIIHKIQFENTINLLKTWIVDDYEDILKGAYIVARIQYPTLDFQKVYQKVEKIKRSVWIELRDNFTPLEQIRILNHILFNENKFSGNNTDFYAPQNSYINEVLDTKKGNPISLAILYMAISRRLGLPVYGVNLPKNFILVYLADSADITDLDNIDENKDILFYINPFNRGAILGKKEIDSFLKQQKLNYHKFFYAPCSNHIIIQRLILNLTYSYEKLGYQDKMSDFEKLMSIFKEKLDTNNENFSE